MTEGPLHTGRCQLYLIGPAAPLSDGSIEQALDAAEVACLLLRGSAGSADELRRIVQLVQGRGVACIIANDPAMAAELGADGVHLDQAEAYGEARRRLGSDAIVGAFCGRSLDAAMEVGERGADYVAFPAEGADDLERLRDWSTMTVVPCVAMGGVTLATASAIAATGAEFLAVEDVWAHADGPAAGVRAYAAAMAAVR